MKSRDTYDTFEDLARVHREGDDWRRTVIVRESTIAIIAPHGGGIEGGTSELAQAIAASDLSCYCFEGLMSRGNQKLHITSSRFNDPVCLDLIGSSQTAVTIHGCGGESSMVHVGGLHPDLKRKLITTLVQSGFVARADATDHSGEDPANICNRCQSGQGIQLELTRELRRSMFLGLSNSERKVTTPKFLLFVSAVRTGLLGWMTPQALA